MTENDKPILPIIPSKEDGRDWNVSEYLKDITEPQTLDLRDTLLPVRNQGKYGTCAAQSAACLKEWQEHNESNFSEYMSPQFVYNNREYWNNDIKDGYDPNEDYGMECRDVMKILNKVGICSENMYPFTI